MNSKKGAGKVSSTSAVGGNSSRGKGAEDPDSGKGNNVLNKGMPGLGLDSQENGWEVYAKKSKSRTGGASSKPWESSNTSSKPLGHVEGIPRQGWGTNVGVGRASGNNWAQASDYRRPGGRGIGKQQKPTKGWETQYVAPPAGPGVVPPLQHGWQWAARGGSSGSQPKIYGPVSQNQLQDGSFGGDFDSDGNIVTKQKDHDSDSDDDDLVDDSDGDLSDDYDSDASQKSHETRKKNKWFNGFFEELDKLTVEEINESNRQWHCPACQNAPGSIDWYKGLQPLMTHAKTKGSTRVKLHRELALLLEEELRRRGTTVVPAGEVFGKWKGLKETTDTEIIWPPMVVIMNTILEQDDNDKWLGMGNQELLDYFSTYAAVKARHSYGPNGHRGMSVLVFEASAMGYLEAERLHKHFAEQGTSRGAWEHPRRNLFSAGGKRQLYGYLARKEDLDTFNYHCQGKSQLKYELKSYQEMVVISMKQMNLDNQQLVWLKNEFVKKEKLSKTVEETFGMLTQKLRETMEENRIVRLRTKIQHQENKEEMDYQEHFFKEQMDKIHSATEEKERLFEKLQQEECAKAKHSDLNSGTTEEKKLRKEEIARFINNQAKGVEEFEAEREKLIKVHEEKKVELRRRYLEEEVKLEKEFDDALTKLMEKYSPATFQASRSSS
ncbi:protein SUPPRESSOR OF GENE SILENCING 3 homolog [Zingiber officinale]|uniref:protein SUPPRESSOR OF GENE SILENCING 3 homolog n=1 Tax=Zingiber officinale TaxID=94328 RepID=UPI001C4D0427|nr:protein SUPPRESSOR OF GENE SILENCING 3 homolog [Zingiber officinale]XP_042374487.1 protein SUPPRESSOR OF GENE SILENCING 3 homolog [Zingiber officinale]